MEGNFGTVGAIATAFVSGFHPLTRNKSRNRETTAAGSPNIHRSYD
ncbi:hypothetical protein [Paenibacillus monticola]|nr:hypothetical protein [Paenibacillus monticola]